MNYILYSAYLPNLTDENSHNQQVFSQLYYSLKTLYDTGYTGNVIFYYDSDIDIGDFNYKGKYNLLDFQFLIPVRFSYDEYCKSITKGAFHKWNVLNLFYKQFEFKKVLYVDNDTIFNSDPSIFFYEYNEPRTFYGKQYAHDESQIKPNINLFENILNTGQFLVNKKLIDIFTNNFLSNLLKEYVDIMNVTNKVNPEKAEYMLWLGEEYAITKLLQDYGITIKQFKDEHAKFAHLEKDTTLIHYYSANTRKMIPQEYWSEFTKNVGGSYNYLS
jgi:hypothetical protein